MSKKALCIRRVDFDLRYDINTPLQFIGGKLWNCGTGLADRDDCETDESLLQVIPYMLLQQKDGRIFHYSRGSGSEEERLRSKLSIGVGGHIDQNVPTGMGLREWVKLEAKRELKEEVGVDVDDFYFSHVISDFSDPVGRVHLGVLAVVRVEPDQVKEMEPGIVDRGGFEYASDLNRFHLSRMENWSKIVLTSYF